MAKNKKKSQIFRECFSPENLKEAFHFARKNVEADGFNTLPLGAGTIDIIEQYKDDFFDALSSEILSKGDYNADKCSILFSRKDASFGIRPISILSFVDRIIYQAILNQEILGDVIEDTLFSCCYANRIDRRDVPYKDKERFMQDYKLNYFPFLKDIRVAHKEGFVHLARMDIQGFYENIHIDILESSLRDDFGVDDDIIDMLCKLLKCWIESTLSNTGLPQGPDPSSILANAYLHSLDKEVQDKFISKIQYFRYNDDIIFLAKEEKDLYECIDCVIDHVRKKNLRANAKSGIHLFADEQTVEKAITQISGVEISTDAKIENCKTVIQSVFEGIKQNKVPDISTKSSFHYYLSTGYDPTDSFDTEHRSEFVNLFIKFPLVIEKLYYFFLQPKIVGFKIKMPINDKDVYSDLFLTYKNGYGNSWQKFNILRLLTLSSISRGEAEDALEFTKFITDEFRDSDDVFLHILYIRFIFEEKSENIEFKDPKYRERLFKKYLQGLKNTSSPPVIIGTILWLFRHDMELIKGIIQHYALSESHELQIITFYYLKKLGKKAQNQEKCGTFMKKLLQIPDESKEDLDNESSTEEKHSTTNIISVNITNIQQEINVQFEEKIKREEESKKNTPEKNQQQITFDKTSGIVKLAEKELGVITIGNQEFYFFEYLFENYGIAKTHKEIASYIQEKSQSIDKKGKNIGEVKNFCSTIKGKIHKDIRGYIHAPKGMYQLLSSPVQIRKRLGKKK